MDIMDLLKEFQNLDNIKKVEFYKLIRQHLPQNISKSHDLDETHFSEEIYCPYCQSKEVKRNGKYQSFQRYLCKACRKGFKKPPIQASSSTSTRDTHWSQITIHINFN